MAKKKAKKVVKAVQAVKVTVVNDVQLDAMTDQQLIKLRATIDERIHARREGSLNKIPKAKVQELAKVAVDLEKMEDEVKFKIPATVVGKAWAYLDGDSVEFEFETEMEFVDELVTPKMVLTACPEIKERMAAMKKMQKDLQKSVKVLAAQHAVDEEHLWDKVDPTGNYRP